MRMPVISFPTVKKSICATSVLVATVALVLYSGLGLLKVALE